MTKGELHAQSEQDSSKKSSLRRTHKQCINLMDLALIQLLEVNTKF